MLFLVDYEWRDLEGEDDRKEPVCRVELEEVVVEANEVHVVGEDFLNFLSRAWDAGDFLGQVLQVFWRDGRGEVDDDSGVQVLLKVADELFKAVLRGLEEVDSEDTVELFAHLVDVEMQSNAHFPEVSNPEERAQDSLRVRVVEEDFPMQRALGVQYGLKGVLLGIQERKRGGGNHIK